MSLAVELRQIETINMEIARRIFLEFLDFLPFFLG
jgi:hypothetical protein